LVAEKNTFFILAPKNIKSTVIFRNSGSDHREVNQKYPDQKRAVLQPFSPIIIYSFSFYRFSHIQTRKLFTLSRKPL